MKKIILTALMALVTMGVSAQVFVVKSGSLQPLLQNDKKAALKIDFSKAKIANLSKDELTETLMMDHLKTNDSFTFENWKQHADECYDFFRERWNEEKTSSKIIEAGNHAKVDFNITINFDYIDFGNAAASIWGLSKKAGGVIMRGTVVFTDANGREVCTLDVNDYRGQAMRSMDMKLPTFGRRLALFHKSMAKEILDFAKKQKK